MKGFKTQQHQQKQREVHNELNTRQLSKLNLVLAKEGNIH